MTWQQRAHFQATNAWQRGQQQIDIQVNDSMQRARNADSRLEREGHYLITNGWEMVRTLGDYSETAARAVYDDIRDTWGTGVMLTNQVQEVFSDNCADDWEIIFETALPALGAALMLLLTPSPGEILENYLEPKALKSSGRGSKDNKKVRRRRGRSGRLRRSFPRFPDVDRLIADRLPGRQAVEGRRATTLTRWTFKGINIVDRFLWWFLLFEATDTFISQWSNNLREARFCTGTFLSNYAGDWSIDAESIVGPGGNDVYANTPTTRKNMVDGEGKTCEWQDTQGDPYIASDGTSTLNATISTLPNFLFVPGPIVADIWTRDLNGDVIDHNQEVIDNDEEADVVNISVSISNTGAHRCNYHVTTGALSSGLHIDWTSEHTANP